MFAIVYRYRCFQLFLAVFSLTWILAAAVEEKGIADGKQTINSDRSEILPEQNKELVVTDTISTEQEASDQPEPTQLRPPRKVTYDANGFYLNGKPALLRGGTFQWFRLPAEGKVAILSSCSNNQLTPLQLASFSLGRPHDSV
ncbi:hypothetical protein BKA69DRAFT_1061923 [Paraphysoderma sedebokerense]|nr:hypothetical protein BKA69DRAFT_1061923 [Paraphysoderma sedebokerense]